MVFYLFFNPNYIIISCLFLSGLMILQTTFKSPIVIPMLRWSSEGDQTAWRADYNISNTISITIQLLYLVVFFRTKAM